MNEFISVEDRLPDVGDVVDIYIKCGKDLVRVCDSKYTGVYNTLHIFEADVGNCNSDYVREYYTVENDGVLYWSNIILPELEEDIVPVKDSDGEVETFMMRIDGKSFRCQVNSCGGNCFHKPDDTKLNEYKCNSCGVMYYGT